MRLPLFLAVAFGSAAALAQAPMTSPVPAAGCGVGLYAQQRGAGGTVWTTALEDKSQAPKDKSGVHIQVSHRDQGIREVTLRVTFLPYGLRALPTDTMPKKDMREESKTFTVHAKNATEKKLTGDLLLGRVSGVKSVAVESIDFADGSSWKAPASNPCSVTPSGYVPVGATASR
jgi:hypothetical protein